MPTFKSYTKMQLHEMNASYPWSKCITNIDNIRDTERGRLYPTGNAGLYGRIYIALPSNLVITPEIKNRYNLWL